MSALKATHREPGSGRIITVWPLSPLPTIFPPAGVIPGKVSPSNTERRGFCGVCL
jgi:hypothetical protein